MPQREVKEIRLTIGDRNAIFAANQSLGDRKSIPHSNAPSSRKGVRQGREVILLGPRCASHFLVRYTFFHVRNRSGSLEIDSAHEKNVRIDLNKLAPAQCAESISRLPDRFRTFFHVRNRSQGFHIDSAHEKMCGIEPDPSIHLQCAVLAAKRRAKWRIGTPIVSHRVCFHLYSAGQIQLVRR